ncbi:hypothetical protein [Amycolatopsis pithecellobii]|uniref:hypothetical protein n=1 Tax=Amycolatopsis pithecellobii TaxID=664692 RepID=UPI001AA046A5|nr:hypothetical protein [Amycolatopsis pithecellobii]
MLVGHDLPLRSRAAGVIVLLYAQPLSRIVRLTVDDLGRDGDQVLLRLGEPPSPVPAPVAELLLAWIGRTAAIQPHVLTIPAPVVADALGYHPVTTTTTNTR